MKKNIFILVLIIFCLVQNVAFAKGQSKNVEINKMEYMNIPFWKHFNDEQLVANLYTVYEKNHDLKATAFKVEQVKKLVKMSFANELPHIGFNGYAGYAFHSSDEVFGNIVIPDYNEARFLMPLTFNYEIDLYGKNHLRTKSYKKSLSMVEQEEKALYIGLTSAFAQTYFNLIKADKLIECQKDLIDVQEKIVVSIQKKQNLGIATVDDVLLQQKSLTFLKEELKNLEEKQDVLQNQLAVMLADNNFENVKRTSYDELNTNVVIPENIDLSLLENRPDRVKTSLNLEKIGINVKIAKKDFLPTFTIVGNMGFNFYNIASAHNFLSNIGVVPNWDLFTGGKKVAMLKMQKAKYDMGIQEYEKTILKSIQETNDSLYTLKSVHNKHLLASERFGYDKREYQLTSIKEEIGTADSLDLLFKEKFLINSKKQDIALDVNEIVASIQLYQALGGMDYIANENL